MMKKLSINIVFFLLLIVLLPQLSLSQSFSRYQFGPFNQSYYATFAVLSPASISNSGALQVTPDSTGNFSLTNRSGRILLNQSFTLWSPTSRTHNRVASFNTSFLVNVYRVNGYSSPGEGLAFLIAPNLTLPAASDGQYLGLTNATTDGSADNKIIAVELDTFKEDFDPDDNHLGLDVNSVRSVMTVPLSDFGIEIAPNGTKFYMLWIDYDGDSQELTVFMAEQEQEADLGFVIR